MHDIIREIWNTFKPENSPVWQLLLKKQINKEYILWKFIKIWKTYQVSLKLRIHWEILLCSIFFFLQIYQSEIPGYFTVFVCRIFLPKLHQSKVYKEKKTSTATISMITKSEVAIFPPAAWPPEATSFPVVALSSVHDGHPSYTYDKASY